MPPVVAAVEVAWAAFAAEYAFAAFVIKVAVIYEISRALSPKIGGAPSLAAMATQVNVRDPAAPRQIIWGERRVSGVLYPVGTSGANNEYLHLILLLADHECDTLGDVTFNDQVVPLDGSGNATGTYAGYVRIKKHLGRYDQTVDTDLQSDLGSGYWPSTCKGGGVAYLYVRLKVNQSLFPGGIPEIYCLVRGRKVYNPGDISQDASNPDTWTWTQNAALVAYDWVRGVPTRNSAGTIVANYGVGADATEVDETVLEDSANNCEELVTLADASTEHRYYANGTLLTSVKAGDGLDVIKTAMAGDVVFSGGKWLIFSGYYRTPTLASFGERDLRAPLTGVRLKPALADLCNSVTGVYVAAQNAWQPSDFPAVVNSTYKTEDGGEDFPTDIELQFTTSPATAQRLAKIVLERSRQGIAFTAKCKLGAWRVRPGDVITWTDADFGWTDKPFEVLGVALTAEADANGQPYLGVDLTLKETASGVWDWADGEETTVDLAPNTALRSPLDVSNPTGLSVVSAAAGIQTDGTAVPAAQMSWTIAADANVTTSGGQYRVEFKKHSDSTWLPWSTPKGTDTTEYVTAVLIGVAYDFRIRSENVLGIVAASWVEQDNVTITAPPAPAAPTGLTFSDAEDDVAQALVRYDTYTTTPLKLYVAKVSWTASTSKNVKTYNVWCTPVSDTPGPGDDSDVNVPGTQTYAYVYALVIGGQLYVKVRAIGSDGQASSYTSIITVDLTDQYGSKTMAVQAASAVAITGGSVDVTTLKKSGTAVVTEARTVNAYPLSSNVTLAASDVGAVPTARTINGHALSANVTVTAADVGLGTTADVTFNSVALGGGGALAGVGISSVGGAATMHEYYGWTLEGQDTAHPTRVRGTSLLVGVDDFGTDFGANRIYLGNSGAYFEFTGGDLKATDPNNGTRII